MWIDHGFLSSHPLTRCMRVPILGSWLAIVVHFVFSRSHSCVFFKQFVRTALARSLGTIAADKKQIHMFRFCTNTPFTDWEASRYMHATGTALVCSEVNAWATFQSVPPTSYTCPREIIEMWLCTQNSEFSLLPRSSLLLCSVCDHAQWGVETESRLLDFFILEKTPLPGPFICYVCYIKPMYYYYYYYML